MIFYRDFSTKFTVVFYVCRPYNSVTKSHQAKSQLNKNTTMHLPFVNLGAKFQPDTFDAHRVETLYLQYTLAGLSLILHKP